MSGTDIVRLPHLRAADDVAPKPARKVVRPRPRPPKMEFTMGRGG